MPADGAPFGPYSTARSSNSRMVVPELSEYDVGGLPGELMKFGADGGGLLSLKPSSKIRVGTPPIVLSTLNSSSETKKSASTCCIDWLPIGTSDQVKVS